MNLRQWKKIVYCLYALIPLIMGAGIVVFDATDMALTVSFVMIIAVLLGILIGTLKFGRCPHCSYLLGRDFYLLGMNHCPSCGQRI